jgi:predicted  nucleic acid-binding Zn-ribbon protein
MSLITTLAAKLQELKNKKAELEGQSKANNEEIENAIKELHQEMINEEIPKFDYNGQTFYIKTERFASAFPDKKLDLYQILKENGYSDLVQETVNASTLKAFVKEQIENNDDALPEWLNGYVRVYEEPTVATRKISGGKKNGKGN